MAHGCLVLALLALAASASPSHHHAAASAFPARPSNPSSHHKPAEQQPPLVVPFPSGELTYEQCRDMCKANSHVGADCHQECKGYKTQYALAMQAAVAAYAASAAAAAAADRDKCLTRCGETYSTDMCKLICQNRDKRAAAAAAAPDGGDIYNFDNCMSSCRSGTAYRFEQCQQLCYNRIAENIPGKKREAAAAAAAAPDIYNFDTCMSSCSSGTAYRFEQCQQLCYNRIAENIPGKKREAAAAAPPPYILTSDRCMEWCHSNTANRPKECEQFCDNLVAERTSGRKKPAAAAAEQTSFGGDLRFYNDCMIECRIKTAYFQSECRQLCSDLVLEKTSSRKKRAAVWFPDDNRFYNGCMRECHSKTAYPHLECRQLCFIRMAERWTGKKKRAAAAEQMTFGANLRIYDSCMGECYSKTAYPHLECRQLCYDRMLEGKKKREAAAVAEEENGVKRYGAEACSVRECKKLFCKITEKPRRPACECCVRRAFGGDDTVIWE